MVCLEAREAVFEFGAQVGVGAVAVEGGAVDVGFVGQGLDVAVSAGRDLAAQQPVHGGADTPFVRGAGRGGDPHALSLFVVCDTVASISVMTRRARS